MSGRHGLSVQLIGVRVDLAAVGHARLVGLVEVSWRHRAAKWLVTLFGHRS